MGFVMCMKDTRLPKCTIFREFIGSALSAMEKKMSGRCLLFGLRAFGIRIYQKIMLLQIRTRESVHDEMDHGREIQPCVAVDRTLFEFCMREDQSKCARDGLLATVD